MNSDLNPAPSPTRDDEHLRRLVRQPTGELQQRATASVACRGMDTNVFFPEHGVPDGLALARCRSCHARLVCLALALRYETSAPRHGWSGGLGPQERSAIAARLGLGATAPEEYPDPGPGDRALRAVRLRAQGWTVAQIATELGVDKRTVYRDFRQVA
ncbi:hypothetical protein A6A08_06970 [Nocardiopsis sp. TSRI0078]|uniref:helix-turn-helix domain-containing protein n=1 Tax=unclassified Nocardiopsis TaxID=2649073 RepID=UPI00093E8003|nr:helix-turn-helix domain-containing protein [Nocardiopsis sp. TSRI0078]OKI17003.1 hypothetical protein A6A08_06970 [Nocardiopsis sp. TSRI0078]